MTSFSHLSLANSASAKLFSGLVISDDIPLYAYSRLIPRFLSSHKKRLCLSSFSPISYFLGIHVWKSLGGIIPIIIDAFDCILCSFHVLFMEFVHLALCSLISNGFYAGMKKTKNS